MHFARGPFSSSELDEAQRCLQEKHGTQLAVCIECHDKLCEVLESARWNSEPSEHAIHGLAARILELLACALQLLSQGTIPAAKVLARSLVETTYKLVAVRGKPELAQQFFTDDDASRLRKLRGLQKFKQSQGLKGLAPGLEKQIDALVAAKRAHFEPHQWAEAAGMSAFHNLFYHWLCEQTHTTATALAPMFEEDPEFTIVLGPNDIDLRHTAVVICRTIKTTVASIPKFIDPVTEQWLQTIEAKIASVERVA